MTFAYIDESGTGDEPYVVMAGVIVDAQRMHLTKEEWANLLDNLTDIVGHEVKEFHTRDFYAGNSPWRGLNGEQRANIITAIFTWFQARRHHIIFSAIDKQQLNDNYNDHPFTTSLGSLWKILASHFALTIQRAYQGQKNNKGNTVLIFDAHDKDEKEYAQLILSPPEWTDTYYEKSKKQKQLDQIIDVPHFVDSKHVGMIQLADCVSFFLRRNFEIIYGGRGERYDGEAAIVSSWVESITERCVSMPAMYPKRGRCEAAEYFYQLAPESLK